MSERAEDRRMTTCPVTIPRTIDPRDNGDRGVITYQTRPCGEPVEQFGLCAKHAADKVRLGGAS